MIKCHFKAGRRDCFLVSQVKLAHTCLGILKITFLIVLQVKRIDL